MWDRLKRYRGAVGQTPKAREQRHQELWGRPAFGRVNASILYIKRWNWSINDGIIHKNSNRIFWDCVLFLHYCVQCINSHGNLKQQTAEN